MMIGTYECMMYGEELRCADIRKYYHFLIRELLFPSTSIFETEIPSVGVHE